MSISDADAVFTLAQAASDYADEATALAERINDFGAQCQAIAPDLEIMIATGAARDSISQALPFLMSAANKLKGYGEALQS